MLAEDLRLQRLAEDLLLLTRADEHPRPAALPVDLDDLVFDEAQRLREATGLRVDTTAVSAGRVDGDAAGLRRVLRNLGDNAARHAAGHLALSVAERDGQVVLAVDDDGPGIPEADRERVFERFVRLDDARARDDGGSGLGLAIVAELVAAHGGTVAVASSPLGGARVRSPSPASPTQTAEATPARCRRTGWLNEPSAAFRLRSGTLPHPARDPHHEGGAGCSAGPDGSPRPAWPWPWPAGSRPRPPAGTPTRS